MSHKRATNPPQHSQGFVRITHERCPDCEYEGNLSTDGRPIVIGGGQLRGATSYVGLTKATHGCDTCKGKGYIDIHPLDPRSIDPYARKSPAITSLPTT
jgi:RecJ-like exonuclease